METHLRRLQADRVTSMGEIAASLAHELNQPLAAAVAYIQTVRRMLQVQIEQQKASIETTLESAA